jgi:cytochrome c oxidase subunit 2
MKLERYEKYWMGATLVFLTVAIVALVLSVVRYHAELPESAARIDPARIDQTAPFDKPGLVQTGPNEYDLVIIAQAWQWTPSNVTIPKGAKVRILATSRDVQHGLKITDTDVNAMILPGYVTSFKATFDEAKTFTMLCHEYCGIGHHLMGTTVTVQ